MAESGGPASKRFHLVVCTEKASRSLVGEVGYLPLAGNGERRRRKEMQHCVRDHVGVAKYSVLAELHEKYIKPDGGKYLDNNSV